MKFTNLIDSLKTFMQVNYFKVKIILIAINLKLTLSFSFFNWFFFINLRILIDTILRISKMQTRRLCKNCNKFCQFFHYIYREFFSNYQCRHKILKQSKKNVTSRKTTNSKALKSKRIRIINDI